MIERLRGRLRPGRRNGSAARRVSRREREEAQRRLLLIGVGIIGILVVGLIGAGALYQYVLLPGQTLASVNGDEINRADYWKVRKLDLLNQVGQYQQFAQFVSGDQAAQYQQLAQQAQDQLGTVETDPVDPATLDRMVDDKVVLQNLDDVGVTVSDADVDEYIAQAFAPAPVASPTPTLGIDPTAAAWATATAEASATAAATAAAEASATAAAQASATAAAATPEAATPTSEESATSEATAPAAEGATGSPTASPEATPSVTPAPPATPSTDEARATATANFEQYQSSVLSQADMSVDDFRRLVVRPQLAREKVQYALASQVPLRAEQVHAAHILVATQEAAQAIVDELNNGADFGELARQQSSDSATAANGGDLGWFPRGVMVPEFDAAAFALEPGQVSEPVQTTFGWHVIKVLEKEQDRPLTEEILTTLRGQQLDKWIADQRAQVSVDWNIDRTAPTPSPSTQFAPPPDAPPTPTPTPAPTPAPTEEAAPATTVPESTAEPSTPAP